MPPIYSKTSIHTGTHDFKTNIARYIRELNKGEYNQIILYSRNKPIAGFYTFEGLKLYEERARMEDLSGLFGGSDEV
ncbi:MAG: hypothetical protein ACLFR0_08750 [Alphaproteobacteria bacterium]